jgi:hypothetical protein
VVGVCDRKKTGSPAPRFNAADLEPALAPIREELAALRAENAPLKEQIATGRDGDAPPSDATNHLDVGECADTTPPTPDFVGNTLDVPRISPNP